MTPVILVVTGEPQWTMQALHLAAAMARETDSSLLLVEMVRVANMEYLGAGVREALLSYDRLEALYDCISAVHAYGIPMSATLYEYTDYIGGLLSAVEQTDALALFAPAPTGLFSFVAAARLWYLRRALRRPLYTLGAGDGAMVWMDRQNEPAPAQALLERSV